MMAGHVISAQFQDGDLWKWKVVTCPGSKGGCIFYADIEATEFYDGCGLEDWLENVGGEMIEGKAELTFLADMRWVHDNPILTVSAPEIREVP